MKSKWHSLLLVVLVLLLASSVVACGQPTTTSPSTTQQVLTTQPPNAQSVNQAESPAIQPAPRVLTQNDSPLTIPLRAGERVEVEVVMTTSGTPKMYVISTVTDPFSNIVAKTTTRTVSSEEAAKQIIVPQADPLPQRYTGQVLNTQIYPWRYAFIAATDGDYVLKVTGLYNTGRLENTATLKATIYPK